VTIIIIFMTAR